MPLHQPQPLGAQQLAGVQVMLFNLASRREGEIAYRGKIVEVEVTGTGGLSFGLGQ